MRDRLGEMALVAGALMLVALPAHLHSSASGHSTRRARRQSVLAVVRPRSRSS